MQSTAHHSMCRIAEGLKQRGRHNRSLKVVVQRSAVSYTPYLHTYIHMHGHKVKDQHEAGGIQDSNRIIHHYSRRQAPYNYTVPCHNSTLPLQPLTNVTQDFRSIMHFLQSVHHEIHSLFVNMSHLPVHLSTCPCAVPLKLLNEF